MLQITNHEILSTQVTKNKKNQDVPSSIAGANDGGIDESIKNLLTIVKLIRSKKSDLPKAKFAKINSGTDFLTPKAKKPLYTYEKLLLRL